MEKEKILIIFTKYKQYGGEETIINDELLHLSDRYNTKYLEFSNKNALSLLFSGFNLYVFFKIVLNILSFKPGKIYINNLWFAGSNAVFYAAFVFKNIEIYYKVHNYRLSCSKGTHFRQNSICELCNHKSKKHSYKFRCYKNSFLLTFLINIFSSIQLRALKNNKITKIYTLNNLQKEKLINSGISRSKIDVSRNIIDIKKNDYFREGIASNTFCFIGRLEEEKGILDLIDVWNQLNTKNFKLIIIGEGAFSKTVEKFAESTNNVEYLGSVSNKNIFDILLDSRALIHPSKWYEGQPTIILEAMHSNTPVISSNISFITTFNTNKDIDTFELGNKLELLDLIKNYMDDSYHNEQQKNWSKFATNFFDLEKYQLNFQK